MPVEGRPEVKKSDLLVSASACDPTRGLRLDGPRMFCLSKYAPDAAKSADLGLVGRFYIGPCTTICAVSRVGTMSFASAGPFARVFL